MVFDVFTWKFVFILPQNWNFVAVVFLIQSKAQRENLNITDQASHDKHKIIISRFFTNVPLPQNILERREVATKERKK